jgi:hypothetical protein
VAQLEKPKEQRILRETFLAIFDRRLFGASFLIDSIPFLAVIFTIQITIYVALNSVMLYFYVPLFIILVFVSGFWSKNMSFRHREVHSMGQFRVFLFSLASVMASLAPFTVSRPSDPWQATAQFLLLYGISTLALTIAVVEITVYGQRISLRNSMKLDAEFFTKQKKVWTEKLSEFPNSDNIVSCIDGAKAVPQLFDSGSFGLALLWSCNIMEQTIDAIADGIISRDTEKQELFRRQGNFPKRYPEQMANLGFSPNLDKNRDDEKITPEALWHNVRNDFAHRNIRPTFQQTFGAMTTLKSFFEEMPEILQDWK